MRRRGNVVGTNPDDPRGVCQQVLFGSGGHDNGDGTCTYGSVTCAYGDMPNKDRTGCQTDRCTSGRRWTRGAVAAAGGALAGYGIARAFFPGHGVRGTLSGAAAGLGLYSIYDFSICLFGDTAR